MKPQLFLIGGLALLFLQVAPTAYPGLIKVDNMQQGSTASLEVKDKDGGIIFKGDMVDINQDGKVEFGVQNQGQIKDILVWKKNSDLQQVHYDGKLSSLPLPSLEPFALPTFGAVNPSVALFTTVDVEAFLNAPNPFIAGQTIAITNGITPLSSALSFKDFSGVPFPTPGPFDLSIIPGLPNFTGTARVSTSFDTFEPIPEPSTWLLLGSGVAGVIWWRTAQHGVRPRSPLKPAEVDL
jgi:hypothetical protein